MTNLHVEAAYEAERSLGSWGKRRCMSESYKTPRVPAGFSGKRPSVTALKTLHHALTPHRAQQRWLDNGTDNGIVLVPQRLRLVRLVERQNAAPPLPRRLCCAD